MRRLWVALVASLVVAFALTSCDRAPAEPADEADFNVTIDHVYGQTKITKKPERVVTMGWITDDVVAGLDLVPVGIPEQWGSVDGYVPWMRDKVKELGGELPANDVVTDEGKPDFERILELKPDLILAPHSGVTKDEYNRLTKIAPTVAYQKTPWMSGDWKQLTALVGKALGRDDLATQRIAAVQKQITDAKAKHPEFDGTTFLYGTSLNEGATESGFYLSGDPRVAFLRQFGFKDAPELSKLKVSYGSFFGAVSLERMSDYSTDLYVAWSNDPASTKRTLNNKLFAGWAPIKAKTYFILEDSTMGYATNAPSVLSVPWALKNGFADDLAKAVGGQPVVRPGLATN